MSWTGRSILCMILAASVCVCVPSVTQAQDTGKKIIRIRKLDSDKVRTPIYRVSNFPQGRTRNWMKITTEYDTAPEWLDQLDFQYYVLVKAKKGKKEFTLFRGDITNVNIEKNAGTGGSRHKSVAYLHPSTLARYGDVERLAVVIRHQGRLVGMESKPKSNARWWEQLTPVTGYVLNRLETPFAMINFDDYEAIKATSTR